ncbi:MAG TPA: DUF4149 domain-containing protein, partial [Nitrospirales bacterium]|nr:DUF4149 domain-containing protein [Nitrospirales bacterium]
MSQTLTTRAVIACGTLEQLGLAIWIGGLIVIVGAVIPSVFNSFGMEPAGRFLARVFDGYNRLVGLAVLLLIGGIAGRYWLAHRAGLPFSLGRAEMILLGTMVVIAGVITFILTPRTIALQQVIFTAGADEAKKAALDQFFRTHQIVRG